MNRRLAILLTAAALLMCRSAFADSTVPALPPATSLTTSTTYLAQGASTNTSLGFLTSVFDISSGALTLKSGGVTGSMLGVGAAASNIGSLGGDLSGTLPSATVGGLQGRPVSAAAPASTNVLSWNGVAWAPAAATGGSGTVGSGTAGQLAYYPSNGTAVAGSTNWSLSVGSLIGNLNSGSPPTAVSPGFQIVGADGAPTTGLSIEAFGTSVPRTVYRRADGTNASKTAIQNGDVLGNAAVYLGYDGTAYSTIGAGLVGTATQTWTNTSHGTSQTFNVIQNGATGLTRGLFIDQDTSIVTGTATGGSQGPGTVNSVDFYKQGTVLRSATENLTNKTIDCNLNTCQNFPGGSGVSITPLTPNIVLSPSPLTGTGTIGTTDPANTQTVLSYTIQASDNTQSVLMTNVSPTTVTIPVATTSGFGSGFGFSLIPAAGTTVTPTAPSTINGLSAVVLGTYQSIYVRSDGTNYSAALGLPQPPTQSHTTCLYDDFTWAACGGGSGTVTHTAGALTANQVVIGNGSADLKTLGSLGTTTTVLHGNSGGAPSFAAVSLTADVSGILPGLNGGTGNGFVTISGPASSLKTFTLPNASATILTDNAAVTVAQGGTGFTSGTSGGIPYFNTTTSLASSAALVSGALVKGGGAGSPPATDANWSTTSVNLVGNYNATSVGAPGTRGLSIVGLDGADTAASIESYANSASIYLRRGDGTNASKTALGPGEAIGIFGVRGYDGTSFGTPAAEIVPYTVNGWSGSDHSTYMRFFTTPSGSTTLTQGAVLESDGTWYVGSNSSSTANNTGAGTINIATDIYKANKKITPGTLQVSQATPADPTGTTDTTGKMMGLAVAITPQATTRIMIVISGTIFNSSGIADGANVQIRYGTGSAPANGDALTGTAVGGNVKFVSSTTAEKIPFSVNAIVTGLTATTAYWVDVGLAAITGGTAQLSDVSVSVAEI